MGLHGLIYGCRWPPETRKDKEMGFPPKTSRRKKTCGTLDFNALRLILDLCPKV